MPAKKSFLLSLLLMLLAVPGFSQSNTTWKYSAKKVAAAEVELTFTVQVAPEFHLYSMDVVPDGPMPLEFSFTPSADYQLMGKMVSKNAPKQEYDEMFETNVKYYSGTATFVQRVKIKSTKPFAIKGEMTFQTCGEGTCIPGDETFSFNISGDMLASATEAAAPATTTTPAATTADAAATSATAATPEANTTSTDTATADNVQPAATAGETAQAPADNTSNNTDQKNESVLFFVLMAIAAGLGAILTPCVFPMIPMTVSFFMQGSNNRMQTVTKAIVFFLSVGLVYGLIGAIVAIFKNPAIAQVISSSWYMNLIFALMFLIFAASFFGMFEIVLPSGFANKADKQVDKGGYVGSFFMALVLAIVSFSCTGPFVGSLLPEAASGTSIVKPILGLTCFGLAMASPFLIVAIFPVLMDKLKSGSWLNSVKVVFAFVMLGFCVKFLNQVDIDANLNIISREVAIGFWIVLAILLGLYLLGKLKFSHDSDVKYVSVPRLGMAIIAFVFAIYLIPGLFGANLDAVSSFLPTKDKQSFDLTTMSASSGSAAVHAPLQSPCGTTPKYSDTKMHLPAGIKGYFDLTEAKECAKQLNKPLLIDIKGFGCTNCKKMEASTFKDQRVIDKINNDFVLVALYYDDKTPISADEQYIAGSTATTIGKRTTEYQQKKFEAIGGPYFAVIDANENILEKGLGMSSADELIEFLDKGLAKFNAAK